MRRTRAACLAVLLAVALGVTVKATTQEGIGWPLCPLYSEGDWMYDFLDCAHAPKPSPEG